MQLVDQFHPRVVIHHVYLIYWLVLFNINVVHGLILRQVLHAHARLLVSELIDFHVCALLRGSGYLASTNILHRLRHSHNLVGLPHLRLFLPSNLNMVI